MLRAAAAPQVVACVECGAPITLEARARLYCLDLCSQVLKFVHYARRAAADGRIDEPDVAAALEMRLAHIAVGGYPETARRIPDKVRAEVFARDDGRCVLCGAPATEIDHIDGDSNDPSNLRSACGDCNLGLAQAKLVPATGDESRVIAALLERALSPEPLHSRDDTASWPAVRASLTAERAALLRSRREAARLLAAIERMASRRKAGAEPD